MNKPYLYRHIQSSNVTESATDSLIFPIERRGLKSGFIQIGKSNTDISLTDMQQLWKNNEPILLAGYLSSTLNFYRKNIECSEQLYRELLNGREIDELLDSADCLLRLGEKFELLSTRFDEADRQELVSVDFDVMKNGELDMEDIWMRVSWLSFLENDESIRFRFSFGMEGFDDVSLDLSRQLAAAELCDRIFPESAIVCNNEGLKHLIMDVANIQQFHYLERIVYYNANKGGAQFHHDAEKGHLGVVYAQLTGQTLWLTMSKTQLMTEIQWFLKEEKNQLELKRIVKSADGYTQILQSANDMSLLENLLDDPANEAIGELLNESVNFFEQLVAKDYGYVLKPGDIILLPQEGIKNCAWHSVFCLGDKAGQALSFAIKAV